MCSKVICPLSVPISKKKSWILNINNYRNAHHHVLAKSKREYFNAVRSQILRLPGWKKVAVAFVIYPKTARRMDISNVLSIHDKYLMDAVTTLGKLDDDNHHHYCRCSYEYGGIDKNNPRVEARFIDLDE